MPDCWFARELVWYLTIWRPEQDTDKGGLASSRELGVIWAARQLLLARPGWSISATLSSPRSHRNYNWREEIVWKIFQSRLRCLIDKIVKFPRWSYCWNPEVWIVSLCEGQPARQTWSTARPGGPTTLERKYFNKRNVQVRMSVTRWEYGSHPLARPLLRPSNQNNLHTLGN